jgi:hypothetical protein
MHAMFRMIRDNYIRTDAEVADEYRRLDPKVDR